VAGGDQARVGIGRIAGVFGIKGWVKIESWTRPAENILEYADWQVGRSANWRAMHLVQGRSHGKGFIAQLADANGVVCSDRSEAERLAGSEIAILRGQLPPLAEGEYYWAELQGLEVRHLDGRVLGRVQEVIETPAHDVLAVAGERQRLIPFVVGPIVHKVDVAAGCIEVDWDPEF